MGAGVPLSPHLTQWGVGRGLPSYQVASWRIQPFGHYAPTLRTRQMGQRSCSGRRTVACKSHPNRGR